MAIHAVLALPICLNIGLIVACVAIVFYNRVNLDAALVFWSIRYREWSGWLKPEPLSRPYREQIATAVLALLCAMLPMLHFAIAAGVTPLLNGGVAACERANVTALFVAAFPELASSGNGTLPFSTARTREVSFFEFCHLDEAELLGYGNARVGRKCCVPAIRGNFSCSAAASFIKNNTVADDISLVPNPIFAAEIFPDVVTRASYLSCCPKLGGIGGSDSGPNGGAGIIPPGFASMGLSAVIGVVVNLVLNGLLMLGSVIGNCCANSGRVADSKTMVAAPVTVVERFEPDPEQGDEVALRLVRSSPDDVQEPSPNPITVAPSVSEIAPPPVELLESGFVDLFTSQDTTAVALSTCHGRIASCSVGDNAVGLHRLWTETALSATPELDTLVDDAITTAGAMTFCCQDTKLLIAPQKSTGFLIVPLNHQSTSAELEAAIKTIPGPTAAQILRQETLSRLLSNDGEGKKVNTDGASMCFPVNDCPPVELEWERQVVAMSSAEEGNMVLVEYVLWVKKHLTSLDESRVSGGPHLFGEKKFTRAWVLWCQNTDGSWYLMMLSEREVAAVAISRNSGQAIVLLQSSKVLVLAEFSVETHEGIPVARFRFISSVRRGEVMRSSFEWLHRLESIASGVGRDTPLMCNAVALADDGYFATAISGHLAIGHSKELEYLQTHEEESRAIRFGCCDTRTVLATMGSRYVTVLHLTKTRSVEMVKMCCVEAFANMQWGFNLSFSSDTNTLLVTYPVAPGSLQSPMEVRSQVWNVAEGAAAVQRNDELVYNSFVMRLFDISILTVTKAAFGVTVGFVLALRSPHVTWATYQEFVITIINSSVINNVIDLFSTYAVATTFYKPGNFHTAEIFTGSPTSPGCLQSTVDALQPVSRILRWLMLGVLVALSAIPLSSLWITHWISGVVLFVPLVAPLLLPFFLALLVFRKLLETHFAREHGWNTHAARAINLLSCLTIGITLNIFMTVAFRFPVNLMMIFNDQSRYPYLVSPGTFDSIRSTYAGLSNTVFYLLQMSSNTCAALKTADGALQSLNYYFNIL